MKKTKIAVVIPCFRVAEQILKLLKKIGKEVDTIYCVDDSCPEKSGEIIKSQNRDPRVKLIFHESNQGVGGATISGYQKALSEGHEIIVKLDGDGQMDPVLIPALVRPIREQWADYVKGNRFYSLKETRSMPKGRLIGNIILSFMAKISTGYWNIFDPTNGFVAIQSKVLKELPLDRIKKNYFFETDILYHLYSIGAVIRDIPMKAIYADEKSSMNIIKVMPYFLVRHILNFSRRIIYSYFIRNISIYSLALFFGLGLSVFGLVFGFKHWQISIETGIAATAGTVMLASLPIIIGTQLLLWFVSYDMRNIPLEPLSRKL